MPQPKLSYFRRRSVAGAIQTTPGVPETLDTAVHGFRMYDGASGIEIDEVADNPDSQYFEGPDFVPANERAFIQGEIRLVPPTQPGDATDGIPENDVVLRNGGLARTLVPLARQTLYTPISDDFEIGTYGFWQSGLFKELSDSKVGLGDLMFEIGQRAKITGVRIQGFIDDLEEAEVADVSVSDAVGPPMQNYNSRQRLRINGGAEIPTRAKMHGLQLNAALTSEEYTEFRQTDFNDRTPTWRCRVARTDLSEINPRNLRLSGAIIELTTRLTGSDGRYVELWTRGKLKDYSEVDIDGKLGFEFGGPTRVSAEGIDFRLTFGDATFALNGTLPGGQQGVIYPSSALTPSGDFEGPLAWDISAGTLPDGLIIDGVTGAITGTPTAAGQSTFTVRATDSSGTPQVATQEVELTIAAP